MHWLRLVLFATLVTWVDLSTNETRFVVERAPRSSTTWVRVGVVGANVTRFRDPNTLTRGAWYCYRVRSGNAVGLSRPSNAPCLQWR